MRLRRFNEPGLTGTVPRSTSGHWFSFDGRWSFHRGSKGWHVYACATEMPADDAARRGRYDQLCVMGLQGAYFKTRREAVAALELMLEGVSV